MLSFTALLVLGIIAGIFLAAFIGANDSANSVGAALGCGLSIFKVIFMAVAFEMIGAIFLGGFVSQTITSKILITPSSGNQDHQVREIMLVMLSVLIGSGSWLTISTILSLPVSTTHSVVGSVVGCGVLMGGLSAVDWWELLRISIWWIASPVVGAVVSFTFWLILKRLVVASQNPVSRMLTALPFLSFLTIFILLLFVIYRGLTPFNFNVEIYVAMPIALCLAAFCACFVWKMIIPEIVKQMTKEASRSYKEVYESQDTSMEAILGSGTNRPVNESTTPAEHTDIEENTRTDGEELRTSIELEPVKEYQVSVTIADHIPAEVDDQKEGLTKLDSQIQALGTINTENESKTNDNTTTGSSESKTQAESDADITEGYVFRFLVVFTSGCIAMAHGANDISNASAPLSVIVSSYNTRQLPKKETTTIMWVTLVTTACLIIGLVTLGYRVMKTVGSRLTKMTPARAFVAQLSTATITLTSSLLGIPLSTTHIVVGCIQGIGIVDMTSIRDLQWRLVLGIFTSWIVTIPFSALFSIAVFAFGRAIL